MKISIVGNVLKDVYLNLDTRTENFETDRHGVRWLDIAFSTSEHHFFNRTATLAGAAISFEVFAKMGLTPSVIGAKLRFEDGGVISDSLASTYRYILVAHDALKSDATPSSDSAVSYFVPSEFATTSFTAPNSPVDYLYIDRSANLSRQTIEKIVAYLDISSETKLALYLQDPDDPEFRPLIDRADLIFLEDTPSNPHSPRHLTASAATASMSDPTTSDTPENHQNDASTSVDATSERTQRISLQKAALTNFSPDKLIHLSESRLRAGSLTRTITPDRIDLQTHLSVFSIAAATILAAYAQGQPLESALDLAVANVENSRLNATLPLEELQNIAKNTFIPLSHDKELELIAANMMLSGKGILAADESGGSIQKKFAQMNIPDTYQNRRDYRNIFFTTPHLSEYVNGVILFDETTKQTADNGQNFVDYLTSLRIIPGVKVDQGLENLPGTEENYTKGLDGLDARLKEYYNHGLRFAKWRAAFTVKLDQAGKVLTPSDPAITENCRILADYALACQKAGLVPIVEPELVYDGYYSVDQAAELTGHILDILFAKLEAEGVNLKACILKVNMVLAGKQFGIASTPVEVGKQTARVLKQHVPHDLAGVVFLSGGQTVEQATQNLAEIIKNGPFPWPLTFSFARALQDPALEAWRGDNANTDAAQKAFLARLKANAEALLAVDF